MHILQTPLSIVGRLDPKQLPVATVPFLRQIVHRQPLLQQGQLQIRADQDV